MSTERTQRVAVITGANRGIGFEMARQLAQRSYHVVVASRDEAKGRRAAEEIEAVGKTSVLPLNVSSSESIKAAAGRFEEIADRVDVLINNAGIYTDDGLTVLSLPRHHLTQTFQTNTFGPLEVTQSFLSFSATGRKSVGDVPLGIPPIAAIRNCRLEMAMTPVTFAEVRSRFRCKSTPIYPQVLWQQ